MEGCRFDVLITDRAMPGMSGTQLARAVRQLHPDVKVIMLTGFDKESKEQALADIEDAVHVVLTKPAKRNEILRTMHDLLNAERGKGNAERGTRSAEEK